MKKITLTRNGQTSPRDTEVSTMHTVCGEGNGDIPDWMFYAICALPFALLLLDVLGG